MAEKQQLLSCDSKICSVNRTSVAHIENIIIYCYVEKKRKNRLHRHTTATSLLLQRGVVQVHCVFNTSEYFNSKSIDREIFVIIYTKSGDMEALDYLSFSNCVSYRR